jgi:hypothetical protein
LTLRPKRRFFIFVLDFHMLDAAVVSLLNSLEQVFLLAEFMYMPVRIR